MWDFSHAISTAVLLKCWMCFRSYSLSRKSSEAHTVEKSYLNLNISTISLDYHFYNIPSLILLFSNSSKCHSVESTQASSQNGVKYKTCKFTQQFACWHEKLPAWQRSLDEIYFTLISRWINWQLTLDSDTFQLNASHSQTRNCVQIDELYSYSVDTYSFHLLFVFSFITNQCLFPSLHNFF